MGRMKGLLLVLTALTLAVTAAPAAAQNERHEGFRRADYEGRWAHERHEGREHDRWGHRRWGYRHFGFVSPPPYAHPYCFWRPSHWAWNGWRYVWVPPRTVCY